MLNVGLTGSRVDFDPGQLHEVPADDDDAVSERRTLGHHQVVQRGQRQMVTAQQHVRRKIWTELWRWGEEVRER